MRIGIDYRMLSAGGDITQRGMGRYTQQQLREVLLAAAGEHEFILVLRPDADRRLLLPEIAQAPNVTLQTVPYPRDARPAIDEPVEDLLRNAEAFQQALASLRLDVFHLTTPFLLTETLVPSFDVCPLVANYFDAIPLVYPREYVADHPRLFRRYQLAADQVRVAQASVAISRSAERDLVHYVGFEPGRVHIGYPMADPRFRPLAAAEVERRLARLRREAGLPQRFTLTVTHLHHSKNLGLLLEAYARLDAGLRGQTPLVITCKIQPEERERIMALARALEIESAICLTGFATDDELAALYNQAQLVIHPSRYEGFGLPIVEAQRCGAPVITTRSSSMPEAGGPAAAYVDADDAGELAATITAVLADPERREAMRQAGLQHSARFDGAQLAAATLDAYRQAVAHPAAATRPRVALWTPLPPLHSGIADYSAELIEELSRTHDLEVFVDDGYLPDLDLLARYRVHHHSAFPRRDAQRRFDSVIYQIGASTYHTYMRPAMAARPGITVLHDLTWGHLLRHTFQRSGDTERLIDAVAASDGGENARELRRVLAERSDDATARLTEFFNRNYVLRSVLDDSRQVVVTMAEAREILNRRYGATNVSVVEMGVRDPYADSVAPDIATARAAAGAAPRAVLIGVFGIVDEVKRIGSVIEAVHALAADNLPVQLVIVGECPNAAYELKLTEQIKRLNAHRLVTLLGRVDEAAFTRMLQACDIVVNLRYPSRMQMSATLMRAIAAAKPVLVSALPEWSHFPPEFCLPIPTDDEEVPTLIRQLRRLTSDAGVRAGMARAARKYFETHATLAIMADQYRDVIRATFDGDERGANAPSQTAFAGSEASGTQPDLGGIDPSWREALSVVLARLAEDRRPVSETAWLGIQIGCQRLPYWLSTVAGRVVVIGDALEGRGLQPDQLLDPEPALPLPYDPERLEFRDMPGPRLRFPQGQFDVVVAGKDSWPRDALRRRQLLDELARVLRPGGVVVTNVLVAAATPVGPMPTDLVGLTLETLKDDLADHPDLHLQPIRDTIPPVAALVDPRRIAFEREPVGSPVPGGLWYREGAVYFDVPVLLLRGTAAARPPESQAASSAPRRGLTATAARPAAGLRSVFRSTSSSLGQGTAPMSVNNEESQLRARYDRWNILRHKAWYNRTLNRLPNWLSAGIRSIVRVVYLGQANSALADLLQEMIRQQSRLAQALPGETQLASMGTEFGRVEEALQTMTGRIDALTTRIDALAVRIDHADETNVQLGDRLTSQAQVFHSEFSGELTTLRGLATDLSQSVKHLEHNAQINRSRWRLLNLGSDVAGGAPGSFTGSDALDILRRCEALHPDLSACKAVDITVQGVGSEGVAIEFSEALGARMSAAGLSYRAPNDLWVFIDPRMAWLDAATRHMADERIARNGWMIVVSAPNEVEDVAPQPGWSLLHHDLVTTRQGNLVGLTLLQHLP